MQNIFIVISTLLIFILNSAYAQDICIPLQLKTQNKNLILPGSISPNVSEIYFFKNTGKQGVWMDHPTHRPMNAGWSSYVRAGNWSALLLNRKNFEISCAVIQPGKVNNLNCMDTLFVCKPHQVTFQTSSKNTYWITEDKSWDDMIKDMNKRGIHPK